MMTQDVLQQALKDANKSRAMLYVSLYRAIAKRHGADEAKALLKEAIYDWGTTLAAEVARCAPANFDGLNGAFFTQPDGGTMFSPRVQNRTADSIDAHFRTCPLKEAWVEAGLSESEVAMFCDIASAADYGTLEAGGFDVSITTWKPGAEGCCFLAISRAAQAAD
jgi:hypothetical protein